MGNVIMLTGAPATGKSTLRKNLGSAIPNLVAYDYGKLLLEQKASEGVEVAYSELRTQSSNLITPANVNAMDEKVIEEVIRLRQVTSVILDSHAVTREAYGFRAVPYSLEQLHRLQLDAVLVLRCDPDVLITRMSKDRQGRLEVTTEMAREHQILQESVGLSYAIACGCPFFILDTTALSEETVKKQAINLLSSLLDRS